VVLDTVYDYYKRVDPPHAHFLARPTSHQPLPTPTPAAANVLAAPVTTASRYGPRARGVA
jgi:hypothetical protein